MTPISKHDSLPERTRRTGPWLRYGAAAAAVAATAVAGARAVDSDSRWYTSLRKPPWQPPPQTFGIVWPPLYAAIAYAAGRALAKTPHRGRLLADLAANLVLNAGWTRLFFARRSPGAALADVLLLDLSNARLIRRIGRVDKTAAGTLVPYAAWCAFATALNASIVDRNRSRRP